MWDAIVIGSGIGGLAAGQDVASPGVPGAFMGGLMGGLMAAATLEPALSGKVSG